VIIVVWRPSRRPFEAGAKAVQLQRGHHDVGGEGADHEAGDPERLVQRDRHDHVDDHV